MGSPGLVLFFDGFSAKGCQSSGRLIDLIATFVVITGSHLGRFNDLPKNVFADSGESGMIHQRVSEFPAVAARSLDVFPRAAVGLKLNLAELLFGRPGTHVSACRDGAASSNSSDGIRRSFFIGSF